MKNILILICIFVFSISSNVYGENIYKDWSSNRFEEVDIPSKWKPFFYADTIISHRDFAKVPFKSINIKDFIKKYGLPTKIIKPNYGDSTCYMIYKLEKGYHIGVYINDMQSTQFSAAALFLPNGEAEGTIIK